ncbi:MAG: hypothetical protein ACR2RL_11520, partial [Gammaproteobacteria bacterium]
LQAPGLRAVSADGGLGRRWTLLYAPVPGGRDTYCDELCRGRLVEMSRARAALGTKIGGRLRVLLVVPDTMDRAAIATLLATHPGLEAALATAPWLRQIEAALPAGARRGHVFLVNPQTRLMMRYDPKSTASDLFEDLDRLLRISKVG